MILVIWLDIEQNIILIIVGVHKRIFNIKVEIYIPKKYGDIFIYKNTYFM